MNELSNRFLIQLMENKVEPLKDNPMEVPDKPGIYSFCLKNLESIPQQMQFLKYKYLGELPVIYVGKAEKSLRTRYLNKHLEGTARNSTFRKSLGALFGLEKEVLDQGKYKYINNHENWLTNWMKENLIFHFHEQENPKYIEENLIMLLHPPLNLQKNIQHKEFRAMMRSLRRL
ncbi:GIY-YIG nuclease family protein [Litchfieldia alkalitelluris]|uniref:GIY-YIG nuclease family protein n=1 Tax=Litchfieldia alkalitelluris TaxID=304268 RepID=UPI000998DFF9|nr:hypothetical protein [Litchfieldia alkalitelluris]